MSEWLRNLKGSCYFKVRHESFLGNQCHSLNSCVPFFYRSTLAWKVWGYRSLWCAFCCIAKRYEAANILECETIEEEEDESCDYIESYDEQKWSVMENIFMISKSGISHQAKKLDCSKRPFGRCALRFTFLKLL